MSGGEKRKLSVAIAICGDSKFIVLDEPTAGMDVEARHMLWAVLKGIQRDRTILLTTHYMVSRASNHVYRSVSAYCAAYDLTYILLLYDRTRRRLLAVASASWPRVDCRWWVVRRYVTT